MRASEFVGEVDGYIEEPVDSDWQDKSRRQQI
jgi:hypothetical protein